MEPSVTAWKETEYQAIPIVKPLSDLQKALILLAPHINITVFSDDSKDAVLSFHGQMEIDLTELQQLFNANLIRTGYRTGRIKVQG